MDQMKKQKKKNKIINKKVIILRDLNRRVGNMNDEIAVQKNAGENLFIVGERILNVCVGNKLVAANAYFNQ